MKILVTGPSAYPWGGQGYGGVERLCALLVEGLLRKGHKVIAAAPLGSILAPGAAVVQTPLGTRMGEAQAYTIIKEMLKPKDVDLVLDMSHQHLLRTLDGWPGLSWIWHDPYVNVGVKFPKTGVVALSAWQQRRFQEKEQLPCGLLDCHMVADNYIYNRDAERMDSWFWLGRLDKDKGAHIAARAFLNSDEKLLMMGPPMEKQVVEYVADVERGTKGRVHWLGELSETHKLRFLQGCKGLWYWPDFPEGTSEAHSMKVVEALCCGLPVLIRDVEPYQDVFGVEAIPMRIPKVPKRYPDDTGVLVDDRREASEAARACWGINATMKRIEQAIGAVV